MSLTIEKERMKKYVTAYKQSLPEPPPNPAPLPNNAARASQTQRTRQRRHGSSGTTPEGRKALSQPQK